MPLPPSASQQRFARRFQVDEPVRLRVLGDLELTGNGRIKDFSDTGVGLQLDLQVPVFANVLIEYRGLFLPGAVAYCHPTGEDFRVGVELEDLPALQGGLLTLGDHLKEPAESALLPPRKLHR